MEKNNMARIKHKGQTMQVGIIGLGRMGISIADRLIKAGHKITGFDLNKVMFYDFF